MADAHHETRKDQSSSSRGRARGRGGNGRGRGRGDGKRRELGRNGSNRERVDKRKRNNEWQQDSKRQKTDEDGSSVATSGRSDPRDGPSYMSIPFPKDEIEAEERRPKRKVAVMVGYAGTGYHGMQINHKEKTIEGDIFAAFVAANAISKANADDPRKSTLVRCARTDKGVHAAGNVISLKLIIEDSDVVKKINDALPPQIRIWGIQRTNNAFSCYQACDSRWYEYLMPSYCLLPPHPESFLGKKVLEAVKEKGLEEEYAKRTADVDNFWENVENNEIQTIIDNLEPQVREEVLRRLHAVEADPAAKKAANEVSESKASPEKAENAESSTATLAEAPSATTELDTAKAVNDDELSSTTLVEVSATDETINAPAVKGPEESKNTILEIGGDSEAAAPDVSESHQAKVKEFTPVEIAIRQIKAAYVAAKRAYRVTPERLSQLQQALNQYVGTHNFHNYTIQKPPNDPSVKRHIKSFVANPTPIQINDTQWLSLKVHGQSFMMHQIRKMVAMAVLVTRCAADIARIPESYGSDRISVPKAPGLGLLLERPVFDTYNSRAKENYDKPEIDFGNYEKEIQEFKEKHIYRRIFELEEKENSFHTFFHQIDNFKSDYFLWVTANGIAAAHHRVGQNEDVPEGLKEELGDEGEDVEGGEG